LGVVITKLLPNCWTWPDEGGCRHMVAEGVPLEMGPKTVPLFRALCERAIPIGVSRPSDLFSVCRECNVRLADLIASALDG
jgi:hypothetical protein